MTLTNATPEKRTAMRAISDVAGLAALCAMPALGVLQSPAAASYVPSASRVAQAPAQTATPSDQTPVLPQRTINLNEQDRHTIREIVLKDADKKR
jgi:hypothetical protein